MGNTYSSSYMYLGASILAVDDGCDLSYVVAIELLTEE